MRARQSFRLRIVFAVIAGVGLLPPTASEAVTWCHDYSWYRVSGRDTNETSPDTLRARLKAAGYKRFPFTRAAQFPDRAMKVLKPGYVIIMDGGGHSGYVNAQGRIDHFIQLQGESGNKRKARDPKKLPQAPIPGNAGGLFTGDTLKQMFNRRFNKNPGEVEVWRPVK